MMDRLIKFWFMNSREKMLLYEATFLLLLSNVFVRSIAFKHIERFLSRHWDDQNLGRNDHEREIEIQEISVFRRSILRAASALPCESLCLSRSIVEFIMLRRRGIPAVILVGARFSGSSSLEAHAWVEAGGGVSNASSENANFTMVLRIGEAAIDR
jgi:Transglutaminase-like superfamily